jgi:hypothetical protein
VKHYPVDVDLTGDTSSDEDDAGEAPVVAAAAQVRALRS